MTTHDPRMLVAAMTGSAAKVLWAFFFARTALDIAEIQAWTGLKRQTAYQALDQLRTYQLVEPTAGAHGRKLWHLGSETLLPIIEETLQLQESEKRTPAATAAKGKNEPYYLSSSSSSQMSEKRTPEPEGFREKWEAARHAGIGEPKRSEIARLEHVTPELIKSHVEGLAPGERLGLAIVRIEGNEIPRRRLEEQSERDERDERSKYITGRFAAYLNVDEPEGHEPDEEE